MPKHQHVLIVDPGKARSYTSTKLGRAPAFRLKNRSDRHAHAQKLLSDVEQAKQDAQSVADETGHVIHDICLEVIGEQDYDLKVESLENVGLGIEVRSAHIRDKRLHATIYVPEGKLELFVKKIERYETQDTKPRKEGGKSRPKNEDLVAGISGIRFPLLRSFWTDDEGLFPTSEDDMIWWEVWIRVRLSEDPDEVFADFVAVTQGSELRLSSNVVKFPERLVFLVFGSPRQWTRTFIPLLNRLAELRRAKEVPTDYLSLTPHEQRDFVEDLEARLTPPSIDAPAVCLLDHGIHSAHPLLRPFLRDEDAQSFNPEWTAVDNAQAHGTEMAGLIVFGEHLPDLLSNQGVPSVPYRLESVRMLRDGHAHPEETWGWVTQESVAIAEANAPGRRRVACLPVTADDNGRDHGRPTSWSGAVDQHAAGQLDGHRRLYIVSAGNIRDLDRNTEHAYPESNLSDSGIEDPGQSWNALTVGAVTNRVHIRSEDFAGYQPVAKHGELCPSSRTSQAWRDHKDWPLKPDIVMEGATMPARRRAGSKVAKIWHSSRRRWKVRDAY